MARPVKKTPAQWEKDILAAAHELFIVRGYEETSINDIMKAAGGAKGMFYRCFQSKEEILNQLIKNWADAYAQKVIFLLNDSERTFSEKIMGAVGAIREMAAKTNGLDTFFTLTNELALSRLTKHMIAMFVPLLSKILEEGRSKGILSIDNPTFYANYIVHGSLGALNSGSLAAKTNISANLDYLPGIVANTLGLNREILTKQK